MNDRRHFLIAAATASAGLALSRSSLAGGFAASPSLVIHAETGLAHVPEDFTGLSYESSQLVHPSFFNASNTGLVAYFKTLGETGVLRIGGNLSEFTTFSPADPANADDNPNAVEGPDPGKRDKQVFTITPRSIRALASFLKATNWKLIYGLNLAGGDAATAAAEAKCVWELCGPSLVAFQFGNEPDLFKHNGDPKDRWTYPEFIAKWKTFAASVRAAVPKAPLAGPDTSFKPEWVGEFAKDTKGQTSLLTAHYYAEGPPTDARMNIDRLLTNTDKFEANIGKAVALANAAGMPYRMSEGNTCYNAGKKGVSDTFASALWAGDFLAHIAALGGKGVNLHGGGEGLYTPIAGTPGAGFHARPVYYGMLMARPLFGATMLTSACDPAGLALTAYAAQKKGKLMVLAFNKSATATTLDVSGPAARMKSPRVDRLTGPAIDATAGVLLGGAEVTANGTWTSGSTERVSGTDGRVKLALPAFSGAVLLFDQA